MLKFGAIHAKMVERKTAVASFQHVETILLALRLRGMKLAVSDKHLQAETMLKSSMKGYRLETDWEGIFCAGKKPGERTRRYVNLEAFLGTVREMGRICRKHVTCIRRCRIVSFHLTRTWRR